MLYLNTYEAKTSQLIKNDYQTQKQLARIILSLIIILNLIRALATNYLKGFLVYFFHFIRRKVRVLLRP